MFRKWESAGGKETQAKILHLWQKRENSPLKINPLDAKTLETIYYLSDGTIKSTDPEIENDLQNRLNLNCSTEAVTLPQSRKRVLDTIQEDLLRQEGDLRQNCLEQLHMWESESDPKTPYIGIAIWWLKEQIAKWILSQKRPFIRKTSFDSYSSSLNVE